MFQMLQNGLQILLSTVTIKIVCWFMKVGFVIPFSKNELESVEQLEEKELLSLINNLRNHDNHEKIIKAECLSEVDILKQLYHDVEGY